MYGFVLLSIDFAAEHVLAKHADGNVRLLGCPKPGGFAVRREFLADDLQIRMGPGVDQLRRFGVEWGCESLDLGRRRIGLQQKSCETDRRGRLPDPGCAVEDPGLWHTTSTKRHAKFLDRRRLSEDRIATAGITLRSRNSRKVVLLLHGASGTETSLHCCGTRVEVSPGRSSIAASSPLIRWTGKSLNSASTSGEKSVLRPS